MVNLAYAGSMLLGGALGVLLGVMVTDHLVLRLIFSIILALAFMALSFKLVEAYLEGYYPQKAAEVCNKKGCVPSEDAR